MNSIYFDFKVLKKQVQEIMPGEPIKEKVLINDKLFILNELIQSVQREPKTEGDLNTNSKKLFLARNIMNSIQNWYYLKKIKSLS